MLFTFLSQAQAQAPMPPPPPPIINTCGAPCDFSGQLVMFLPIVAAILGLTLSYLFHRKQVEQAAKAWAGSSPSWMSLWLMPILSGVGCVFAAGTLLVSLALAKPDFRMLLITDWTRPINVFIWFLSIVLTASVLPILGASRSNASLKSN